MTGYERVWPARMAPGRLGGGFYSFPGLTCACCWQILRGCCDYFDTGGDYYSTGTCDMQPR
jgi:hypothetical protein